MIHQHWSRIPTLKIASVAFLIICCFVAKSWVGGCLSEEDGLQSCSAKWYQGGKEGNSQVCGLPLVKTSASRSNGICLSIGLYLLRLVFPEQLPAVSAKAKQLSLQSSWPDVCSDSPHRGIPSHVGTTIFLNHAAGCGTHGESPCVPPRQVNSQEEAEEWHQSKCVLLRWHPSVAFPFTRFANLSTLISYSCSYTVT